MLAMSVFDATMRTAKKFSTRAKKEKEGKWCD